MSAKEIADRIEQFAKDIREAGSPAQENCILDDLGSFVLEHWSLVVLYLRRNEP